jgi:Cys-rich four helix bundle protein (predicted Tat secretion target)
MTQPLLAAKKDQGERSATLTRRAILMSAVGGLLAGQALSLAHAEESGAKPSVHGQYHDLGDAALNCVGWGERCQNHIQGLFASGDTSLAQCSARIHDMIAVCRAVVSLAAAESAYLKPLAKVCLDVCDSCEKECRKHEQRHAICKETADACARMVAACKKILV